MSKYDLYDLSEVTKQLQEAKTLTMLLQAELINRNQQLIEAQEKLLHPVVKVRTATKVYDACLGDWMQKGTKLLQEKVKKYEKIVKELQERSPLSEVGKAVFFDTVASIIGDDANVEPDSLTDPGSNEAYVREVIRESRDRGLSGESGEKKR